MISDFNPVSVLSGHFVCLFCVITILAIQILSARGDHPLWTFSFSSYCSRVDVTKKVWILLKSFHDLWFQPCFGTFCILCLKIGCKYLNLLFLFYLSSDYHFLCRIHIFAELTITEHHEYSLFKQTNKYARCPFFYNGWHYY